MQNLSKENRAYWLSRAEGYSKVNKEELSGIQRNTWSTFLIKEIEDQFPEKDRNSIKILDVGAGPGFISIILAEAGFQVTAFDFAETMLEEARANAKELADKITFIQGDALELPFAKGSFDVVFSRNLTWNLEHPDKAYIKWLSVLKDGGLMMVFDANWYAYLIDDEKRMAYDRDRENVKSNSLEDYNIGQDFDIMERIAKEMPMTGRIRPAWDKEYLESINAGRVSIIEDIGSILYSEKEKINYCSTPLFMVRVVKGLL